MSEKIIDESKKNDKRISYITSTHGQQQLIYNQQRYCLKQKNIKSKLWRCTKTNCPASLTVSHNDTIIRLNEFHNHLIEINEIKILKLRHQLKKEAQITSTPIDKIVEIGYSDMIVQENITDTVPKLPTIKTLKNTLSKQRRKIRPPLPKSLDNLPFPLPSQYTLTKQNSKFLLFDGQLGGKRGLIFASENDISYLAKQKYWYSDGTFYTSPSIFYQIYSIHTYDEGLSSPSVYALLADKSEATYQDFFSVLMKKMKEISNVVQLESITIDFEVAVKNVFDKNFPRVRVKGCLFHYGQALFRKFVNLELRTAFQNDEQLRLWFRSFAATALLPEKDVDDAIENLYSIKPVSYQKQIDLFLQYHRSTYGNNTNFPPSMYNHYKNINPRTINHLEGRHNKWKKRSLKPHDDIYRCIDLLKNEQLITNDQRERSESGEAPPKQQKKVVLPKKH